MAMIGTEFFGRANAAQGFAPDVQAVKQDTGPAFAQVLIALFIFVLVGSALPKRYGAMLAIVILLGYLVIHERGSGSQLGTWSQQILHFLGSIGT